MTKECENCEGAAPCVRCNGTRTCDECDGTGVVGEGNICPICGGTGECQQCHGRGDKDCPECYGEGFKAPLDHGSSKPRRTYPERPKGPINTGDEPDADQVWNAAIYAAMDAAQSMAKDVIGQVGVWEALADLHDKLKALRKDSK